PEKCVGCWMCVMSCPHGAIRQDRKNEKAKKCDLCIDRGKNPRCVEVCPKKVLVFTEVDENRRPITENYVEANVFAGDSK
ncbi:MAG: 4Fe-4S dicluster domain-containing protein, partial [Nitrospirota bacterium]